MLFSADGAQVPEEPGGEHWRLFTLFRAAAALYDPMIAIIRAKADQAVAAGAAARPFIDSAAAGAEALEKLGSWWHGEFNRTFKGFPGGTAASVFGMALWNHLAVRPNDNWRFVKQPDPHADEWSHMRYWIA